MFRHDREHSGAGFTPELAGFRGNLLVEAASVFDVLYREHGMRENACWFHARRPFYRALETNPRRPLEALSLIELASGWSASCASSTSTSRPSPGGVPRLATGD